MGYTLYAFIAKRGTFDEFKTLGERITVVDINEDYDLLLNDTYFHEGFLGAINWDSPEGFENWILSDEMIHLFKEKSYQTPIAYVLIDYFGGVGKQQAIVWQDGNQILKNQTPILPRPKSYGPANEALRLIGVIAAEGKDEFETIGLHLNSQMEYWFEKATGIDWQEYIIDLSQK